jgi:hypothetical protein
MPFDLSDLVQLGRRVQNHPSNERLGVFPEWIFPNAGRPEGLRFSSHRPVHVAGSPPAVPTDHATDNPFPVHDVDHMLTE